MFQQIPSPDKKWTYFDAKMPLNPLAINKTASKPWSNLVKFSAKTGVFSSKTAFFRPKTTPNIEVSHSGG